MIRDMLGWEKPPRNKHDYHNNILGAGIVVWGIACWTLWVNRNE
jgi:hypothetical protein